MNNSNLISVALIASSAAGCGGETSRPQQANDPRCDQLAGRLSEAPCGQSVDKAASVKDCQSTLNTAASAGCTVQAETYLACAVSGSVQCVNDRAYVTGCTDAGAELQDCLQP